MFLPIAINRVQIGNKNNLTLLSTRQCILHYTLQALFILTILLEISQLLQDNSRQ